MTSLVLTLIGDDRPGLVSAVSTPVEQVGGSWQRSELTRLAGKFAGVVLVEVPDDAVTELARRLAAVEELHVQVEQAGTPPATAATWRLDLLGADRPGIVAEISRALAEHGVGIDELATEVREAPMAGSPLFEVAARLSMPADADVDVVREALERLADELMVDLTLGEDAIEG
ncbi:MAG: amino acid-binding ACT protein [Nocardioides sp.]|nr:amino acid-binding ACT protein [Nocardioides sp.]